MTLIDGTDRGSDVALPTLIILAGSGAALLTTLAARIIMARALTPAELGLILLGVALVSGVGGAASLGLGAAAGRRAADLRAKGRTSEAHISGEAPSSSVPRAVAPLRQRCSSPRRPWLFSRRRGVSAGSSGS